VSVVKQRQEKRVSLDARFHGYEQQTMFSMWLSWSYMRRTNDKICSVVGYKSSRRREIRLLEEAIGLTNYWKWLMKSSSSAVHCKSKLAVAGQFRNPEEGEHPPLESVTGGLVKREQTEKTQCVLQWTSRWEIATALELAIIRSNMRPINPAINPNPHIYIHTLLHKRDNIYTKVSLYFTRNTLRLRYRAQPVNVVWGNSRCLLWEPYGTHSCI
jgi:hypothetical protein